MLDFRKHVLAVCAIMLIAAITAGAGVGSVAAQDDEGGIPSIPAVYHGEITVSEGSIDGPVLVDAVADGEIQDSMITDADGIFGGPTVSDEKLEVQEPSDGTVEFHIDGEPVMIQTLDGETVESESIGFDSGTQEVELEADPSDLEPSFDISITETNSPVQAEDTLSVTVEIDNIGSVEASPELELQDEDGDVVASTSTTVPIGEAETSTISWMTTEDDVGEQTVTVVSGNETASTDVEIEPPDIAEPTPGGEDGQGGAGVPAADTADTDSTDTEQADDGLLNTESQLIVTSEEFGLSQVKFTTETALSSITWETSEIPEELATVDTYQEAPETVPSVPGDMLSVSEIHLPGNATEQPATIEFRADQAALEDADASPEELTIARFTADSWEPLETTVVDETNETVTLEAETPGFSYFAVTTTSPQAVIDAPESVETGEEFSVSAADSTTPFGTIENYDWMIAGESHAGENVTTTLRESGETTIELTVENDAGETDTTTTTVTTTGDDNIPGFGIFVTLSALLGSALLLARRQR